MNVINIAGAQIKLFTKNPKLLLLFVAGPLFLIYIFGEAFSSIFASAPLSAKSYFGSTLLTMALMQGAYIAFWAVSKDRNTGTEPRLALAPVSVLQRVLGAFLASFISLSALAYLILGLCVGILSIRYQASLDSVLLVLAITCLLATSIGMAVGLVVKKDQAASGILNVCVPLVIFLGGGYAMIPDSGFLHEAARFSPLRWLNLALMSADRAQCLGYLRVGAAYSLGVSLFLLAISALVIRRKS